MKKILGVILIVFGIALGALGIIFTVKGQISSSLIGGSDGPAVVFAAGKIGNVSEAAEIIAGIVLLAAGIFMIAKKKDDRP